MIRQAQRLAEAAGALLLAAIVVVILLQVVTRYILSISVPWSEEAARYLLVWLMFIGAAAAAARHQQIRVDMLLTFVSKRVRLVMHAVAGLGGLVAIAVLVYAGRPLFGPVGSTASPVMELEMRWVYAAMPVGVGLIGLFLVRDMIRVMRGREPEPPQNLDEPRG